MNNKPYRIFLIGGVLLLAGCVARNDPLFSKHIKAADQAIEDARGRGVDKQDPAKFRALVKLRDDAEKAYMACFYYKAKDMTRQVVQTAKALEGLPKTAVKSVPAKKRPASPKAVKTSVRKPLKFGVVQFDFDRYTVKPKFYPVLNQAVSILKKAPGLRMSIEGHADSVGTLSYNQALSEKRAESVMNYLVKKGVSRDRISIKGFGKESPVASNDTEEGRARNRRVVLSSSGNI